MKVTNVRIEDGVLFGDLTNETYRFYTDYNNNLYSNELNKKLKVVENVTGEKPNVDMTEAIEVWEKAEAIRKAIEKDEELCTRKRDYDRKLPIIKQLQDEYENLVVNTFEEYLERGNNWQTNYPLTCNIQKEIVLKNGEKFTATFYIGIQDDNNPIKHINVSTVCNDENLYVNTFDINKYLPKTLKGVIKRIETSWKMYINVLNYKIEEQERKTKIENTEKTFFDKLGVEYTKNRGAYLFKINDTSYKLYGSIENGGIDVVSIEKRVNKKLSAEGLKQILN